MYTTTSSRTVRAKRATTSTKKKLCKSILFFLILYAGYSPYLLLKRHICTRNLSHYDESLCVHAVRKFQISPQNFHSAMGLENRNQSLTYLFPSFVMHSVSTGEENMISSEFLGSSTYKSLSMGKTGVTRSV